MLKRQTASDVTAQINSNPTKRVHLEDIKEISRDTTANNSIGFCHTKIPQHAIGDVVPEFPAEEEEKRVSFQGYHQVPRKDFFAKRRRKKNLSYLFPLHKVEDEDEIEVKGRPRGL